jgi:hypothetical protein
VHRLVKRARTQDGGAVRAGLVALKAARRVAVGRVLGERSEEADREYARCVVACGGAPADDARRTTLAQLDTEGFSVAAVEDEQLKQTMSACVGADVAASVAPSVAARTAASVAAGVAAGAAGAGWEESGELLDQFAGIKRLQPAARARETDESALTLHVPGKEQPACRSTAQLGNEGLGAPAPSERD